MQESLEELLRNIRCAKDAISPPNISSLSGEDAKSARLAYDSVTNLTDKVRTDVKPTSEQEPYITRLISLCGIPLNNAANQLKADILSGVEHTPNYYQTEFSKLALFASATSDVWKQRTTHELSNIENELSRYDFGETLIASKYGEIKDMSHLLEDFKHGAQMNTIVMSYILKVHEKLVSQPPDWSPLGEYYPDTSKWIVSDLGRKKEIKKVKGFGRILAGTALKTGAKFALSFVVPGASLLFLNPADYISDFVPTGVLSVSEKETLDLAALRVNGAMGKKEGAPVIIDCVYTGRILSHPKFIQHTMKDVAMKANNARAANQFAAECFVVNLRDDKDGKFARFVKDFKDTNYAVYAYDYPRKSNNNVGTLIYNKNDWKTAQFAGWFEPDGKIIHLKDALVPDGKEGGVPYINIESLKNKFSGCDENHLLKLVRKKYPAADKEGEDIILYQGRR